MNENINQLNENFETYQEILKNDMDYQNNNITSSNEQIKCYCGHTDYCDCGPLEGLKQETLEEVAENYSKKMWGVYYDDIHPDIAITQTQGEITIKDFISGAKWQQEQDKNKFSEEDMINFAEFVATYQDKNKN